MVTTGGIDADAGAGAGAELRRWAACILAADWANVLAWLLWLLWFVTDEVLKALLRFASNPRVVWAAIAPGPRKVKFLRLATWFFNGFGLERFCKLLRRELREEFRGRRRLDCDEPGRRLDWSTGGRFLLCSCADRGRRCMVVLFDRCAPMDVVPGRSPGASVCKFISTVLFIVVEALNKEGK